jgi:hypothetical protein
LKAASDLYELPIEYFTNTSTESNTTTNQVASANTEKLIKVLEDRVEELTSQLDYIKSKFDLASDQIKTEQQQNLFLQNLITQLMPQLGKGSANETERLLSLAEMPKGTGHLRVTQRNGVSAEKAA